MVYYLSSNPSNNFKMDLTMDNLKKKTFEIGPSGPQPAWIWGIVSFVATFLLFIIILSIAKPGMCCTEDAVTKEKKLSMGKVFMHSIIFGLLFGVGGYAAFLHFKVENPA